MFFCAYSLRADEVVEPLPMISDGAFADDVWVDPADTLEEDVVTAVMLPSEETKNDTVDPKFGMFLADIGGRLSLPQTYQAGLKDLVISLRNDQMWKNDATMRRSMLNLLQRAEVYGRRNGGLDVQAVDAIIHEAFELWPPGPDRARIVGLMNNVTQFQDRQAALAQAAQEKAEREAAKEAERLQKERDKIAAKEAAQAAAVAKEAAKEAAAAKAKTAKTSAVPRAKKQKLSAVDAVNSSDTAALSTDEATMPLPARSPRGRKKQIAAPAVVVEAPAASSASTYSVPERTDHLQNFSVVPEQPSSIESDAVSALRPEKEDADAP